MAKNRSLACSVTCLVAEIHEELSLSIWVLRKIEVEIFANFRPWRILTTDLAFSEIVFAFAAVSGADRRI